MNTGIGPRVVRSADADDECFATVCGRTVSNELWVLCLREENAERSDDDAAPGLPLDWVRCPREEASHPPPPPPPPARVFPTVEASSSERYVEGPAPGDSRSKDAFADVVLGDEEREGGGGEEDGMMMVGVVDGLRLRVYPFMTALNSSAAVADGDDEVVCGDCEAKTLETMERDGEARVVEAMRREEGGRDGVLRMEGALEDDLGVAGSGIRWGVSISFSLSLSLG